MRAVPLPQISQFVDEAQMMMEELRALNWAAHRALEDISTRCLATGDRAMSEDVQTVDTLLDLIDQRRSALFGRLETLARAAAPTMT